MAWPMRTATSVPIAWASASCALFMLAQFAAASSAAKTGALG